MDKTVEKAFKILELVADSPSERGVTEIAKALGFTRSNAHRLLTSLAELGYVENVGQSGRYRSTLKLWELGAGIVGRLDIRTAALDAMGELAERTDETVHLSLLSGADAVCIHQIDCHHQVRPHDGVGSRAPAYCVATGKVMLAFLSGDRRAALIAETPAHTQHTLVSPAALAAEFAEIAEAGVAYNRGEWSADILGVAAPVRDASGAVTAAVGLSIPITRCRRSALPKLAPLVVEAAEKISQAIGHIPSPK